MDETFADDMEDVYLFVKDNYDDESISLEEFWVKKWMISNYWGEMFDYLDNCLDKSSNQMITEQGNLKKKMINGQSSMMHRKMQMFVLENAPEISAPDKNKISYQYITNGFNLFSMMFNMYDYIVIL